MQKSLGASHKKITNLIFAVIEGNQMPLGVLCVYEQILNVQNFTQKFQVNA